MLQKVSPNGDRSIRLTATRRRFQKVGAPRLCQESPERSACRHHETRPSSVSATNLPIREAELRTRRSQAELGNEGGISGRSISRISVALLASFAIALFITNPLTAAPPQKPPRPEIFSFTPSEGPAGTVIKVKGTGFEQARYVLFCVERTGRNAHFKVVSDTELEVTAPPYLRGGVAATLVVVTPNGAAVGMPPSVLEVGGGHSKNSAATFYHVTAGGHVDSPQGIVLVENGGTARAPHEIAVGFVKNGGTLLAADRFNGLVIHEPGAILTTEQSTPVNSSTRLMKVREISASLGIEPFLYHRADSSDAPAEAPPVVKSMSPRQISIGGILTLNGTGLSGTSEVLFVAGETADNVLTVDFRIVSDERLEVEVPESLTSDARMLVVNPKGATVVVAQNEIIQAWVRNFKPASRPQSGRANKAKLPSNPLTLVTNGAVISDAGTRGMYFVKSGGRVTHTGGSCVYFIKDGGQVEGSGGRTFVVREPQGTASITGTIANTKTKGPGKHNRRGGLAALIATNEIPETDREVESLSLSVVTSTFEIVPP